jgi:glutathione peroxidase
LKGKAKKIYDYSITTGTGEELKLSDYKGKVILMVHSR